MKKQLIAIILLVCTILLCACGGSGETNTTTTTKKDSGNTTPSKLLVSDYFASLATDNGASLTIDGSNATLILITDTDTVTYTGAYTVSADKLTIGDKSFDFTAQEKFISVKDGDNEFKMAPTTATGEAYVGVKMLSTAWSGNGLSISFKGMQCTFKLEGVVEVTAECLATSSYLTMDIPAENFALSGTVEVTSCSQPDQLPPEAIIDGDEATRWSSWYDKNTEDPSEDDQTVLIDLGEEKNITTIRLMWETAAGKDYTVEISKDNAVWTTVADVKDNDVTGEFIDYTFDKTAARYVKVHGTARTTIYGFSIWELEVYENFVDGVDTFYSIVDGNLKITYGGQEYTLSPVA